MSDEQLKELFEERAAIIEFEGKRPRREAEARAKADIEEMKRNQRKESK